jgi:hypothetical protein
MERDAGPNLNATLYMLMCSINNRKASSFVLYPCEEISCTVHDGSMMRTRTTPRYVLHCHCC